MNIVAIGVGAIIFAGAAGSADAAQFVVNGDFTQLSNGPGLFDAETIVTGWSGNNGWNFVFSVADEASQEGVRLWDMVNGGASTWNGLAGGGGNFAAMDGDLEGFGGTAITQIIGSSGPQLEIGKYYTLSFDYAFAQQYGYTGGTTQSLTVTLAGSLNVTLPSPYSGCDGNGDNCTGGYVLPSTGFSGWTSYSATIMATSPTEILSFLASGSKPVPPFALVSDVSLTSVPEPSTWAMMLLGFVALGSRAQMRGRRTTA
jgi:hypothetical protein